ncbi:unnamed protein product [Ixodes pacificus]
MYYTCLPPYTSLQSHFNTDALLLIAAMDRKKRKVDTECRNFNQEWGVKYLFIQSGEKAACLVCNETVAVLKEYNLRRHYETNHEKQYSKFVGAQRAEKYRSLERGLHSQRAVFSQQTQQNELVTLASYDVAHELAKRGKPFTDGEMVKDCALRMATRLFPDKINIIRHVSLAPNTVPRRVEDIGTNITCQIAEEAKQFTHYSLALDQSTDVCDTSQLLVLIRGVDSEFNVTEEIASVHSMHGTVTGEDIFRELEKTVSEYNLKWGNLKSAAIDGGKNMSGVRKGLVGQITKAAEVGGLTKPMFLHSMIHQQALCGKYVDMSCVLKPVVSAVNYTRLHGLNHRQFR